MANYNTIFHGIAGPLALPFIIGTPGGFLGPLTAKQVRWIENLLEVGKNRESKGLRAMFDDDFPGFEFELKKYTTADGEQCALYIGGISGYLHHAAEFYRHFLRKFAPKEWIAIYWADICDRDRMPEDFAGGAAFITAIDISWMSSTLFVAEMEAKWRQRNAES